MQIGNYTVPGWDDLGIAGLKVLIVMAFAIVGTIWLVNRITSFHDWKAMEENEAYAVARGGLTFGAVISMFSLINYVSNTANDLMWVVGGGVAVAGFYLIARLVLSKAVPFAYGVESKTFSVGMMRAMVYVALGLLLYGAFGVAADTNGKAAAWMIVSFAEMLLVQILVFWIISHKFGLMEKIREGCLAAAILGGSIMMGLAWAVSGGMKVTFGGWVFNHLLLGLYTVGALTLFVVTLWTVDKFSFRNVHLRDMVNQNLWKPALVMGSLVLSLGGVIGNVDV